MDGDIKKIRIHPGIGMARLGNSDEFFVGPEAPGVVVDPGGTDGPGPEGGTYRDSDMKLKRQAQRFRIYGYDENDNVVGEINAEHAEFIQWHVHVRNMKAANYAFQGAYLFDNTKFRNPGIQGPAPGETMDPISRDKLIIDPGVRTISTEDPDPQVLAGNIFTDVAPGTLPGYLAYEGFTPENPAEDVNVTYQEAKDIEIGQIHLDDVGRLLFVAGPGKSDCVTTPRTALSNPSEHFNPPNGPDPCDPLVNQFAYFNVPGWWDDTCGGEIDVSIVLNGEVLSTRDNVQDPTERGSRNATRGAWVVSAPPKYAPDMYHVVTLKDRVFEAFPEADPNRNKKTEFFRDIYPILSRAVNYGWVSAEAAGVTPANRNLAHGPNQAGNLLSGKNLDALKDPGESSRFVRQQIYKLMRHAEGPNSKLIDTLPKKPPPASAITQCPINLADDPNFASSQREARGNQMPKLWGTGGKPLQNEQLNNNLPNQYLSLTANDLARMKDWADGDFVSVGGPIEPVPLEQLPIEEQPLAMDCAALEPTIGGGFHPGIEFPYIITYREYFKEAFRVIEGTEPGSVAAYMSSPWQGDYWSCNTAWWPVQRPEIVFSYDGETQTRTYREWFRGVDQHGQPLSSTDGYDQMVYAWPKLGMVLPKRDARGNPVVENGSVVYEEFERDPSLNRDPGQTGKPEKSNG